MRYYWWGPDDSDTDWVFYEESKDGLQIRPTYREFMCNECRKLDHYTTLSQRGVHSEFVPLVERDYQHTSEGLACLSLRAFHLLQSAGGACPYAFPIPSCSSHVIVWPRTLGHVDPNNSTVRFHRQPCNTCGRHLEVTMRNDSFLGVCPPAETRNVFGLDICCEGRNFYSTNLYMNEGLKWVIESEGLTGLTIQRCGQYANIVLRPAEGLKREN